jgi:hypothetical protein
MNASKARAMNEIWTSLPSVLGADSVSAVAGQRMRVCPAEDLHY